MFGKRKVATSTVVGSGMSLAEQHRLRYEQTQQAQRERNQRDFDRWLEHKLYSQIDAYLAASSRGQAPFEWEDHTYGPVAVSVNNAGVGVCVRSLVAYISPAVESYYRGKRYVVDTRVVTEQPDVDLRGRSYGMEQLDEPMYVTTITW